MLTKNVREPNRTADEGNQDLFSSGRLPLARVSRLLLPRSRFVLPAEELAISPACGVSDENEWSILCP